MRIKGGEHEPKGYRAARQRPSKPFPDPAEVRAILAEGLAPQTLAGKRVLVLTPDGTRTAPLPMMVRHRKEEGVLLVNPAGEVLYRVKQ